MLAAHRPGVNFAHAKLTPCGRNDHEAAATAGLGGAIVKRHVMPEVVSDAVLRFV
eukprot:COSAG01_NODE_35851_length_525_cov_9.032864_1_plen_54_part_10